MHRCTHGVMSEPVLGRLTTVYLLAHSCKASLEDINCFEANTKINQSKCSSALGAWYENTEINEARTVGLLGSSQFSLVLSLIFVASIGKTHLAYMAKDGFCLWGLSYIALVTKPLFSKNLRDLY